MTPIISPIVYLSLVEKRIKSKLDAGLQENLCSTIEDKTENAILGVENTIPHGFSLKPFFLAFYVFYKLFGFQLIV